MSSEKPDKPQDQSRLCPTCRNEISILATRCFHCGEEVGRPKREQAQLTIEDLGGERKTTYTVSYNVMDALEAFRADEMGDDDMDEKEGMGAKLPELDDLNKALAGGDTGTHRKKKNYGPTPKELAIRYSLITLLTFATVVGCFYGYRFAKEAYIDYKTPPVAIYDNRAMMWLQTDRPLREVLEEAQKALRQNNTEENQTIANTVRDRIRTEIDGLLNADPWNQSYLGEASSLASHVMHLDNNTDMIRLAEMVNSEVMAYKFILKSLDTENQSARFVHNGREYEVQVGEKLLDRFELRKVTTSAILVDTLRKKKNGTYRNFQQSPNGALRSL